ncbi:MAG TPA: phosphoribosyltransferase family protein [Patescibacteria group bacterium]|nr:phosphoribosyltransferase family protein [Patescibacteria group bacterium]
MSNEVVEILQKVGAVLLNDHFVGTSGRHLEGYVNKDALFPHTEETSRIGQLFAETFKNHDIDTVAAPAMGGIILSQWAAYHLSKIKGKEIYSVYAEKVDGNLQLTRGYDAFVKGKKVLVIEDLTTTGESLKKVIQVVQEAGGKIVAASVMLNKDPELVSSQTFGVPFVALAELRVRSFDEKDCPLCQKNVPINVTVGHGKKYLQQKI